MADRVFTDRRDAGRVLAGLLDRYRDRSDVVVLALPRGGVPVGYEVAVALNAPLDVVLVRKLGVPGHEELAIGAIASRGVLTVNDDIVRRLSISRAEIEGIAERQRRELMRQEAAYRAGGARVEVHGKTVIVVDDGLATGASMRAAVEAVTNEGAERVVVAVPTAPRSTCDELSGVAAEVVCATTPSPFYAVGSSYLDFTQTTDDEVRALLRASQERHPQGATGSPCDAAIRA
jgi:predicted phosphoribosyltransferase